MDFLQGHETIIKFSNNSKKFLEDSFNIVKKE